MLCVDMGTYSIMETMLLDPSSQEAYQVAIRETACGSSLNGAGGGGGHLYLGNILLRLKEKTYLM